MFSFKSIKLILTHTKLLIDHLPTATHLLSPSKSRLRLWQIQKRLSEPENHLLDLPLDPWWRRRRRPRRPPPGAWEPGPPARTWHLSRTISAPVVPVRPCGAPPNALLLAIDTSRTKRLCNWSKSNFSSGVRINANVSHRNLIDWVVRSARHTWWVVKMARLANKQT